MPKYSTVSQVLLQLVVALETLSFVYFHFEVTNSPLNHLLFCPGPGCPNLGYDNPGVSAKFELRYESLKSKFSSILFAYNLILGYSKVNRENYR